MFGIVLSIVIGCGALIAAFRVKTWYQGGLGVHKVGPPLPLWFGRLIAVIVGIGFLFGAFQEIRHR
jgi:hypothetical protein